MPAASHSAMFRAGFGTWQHGLYTTINESSLTMNAPPTEFLDRHQQEQWITFCQEARATGITFSHTSAGANALATAFDFSEFVSASCIRHPHMALDLIDSNDLFESYDDGDMVRRLA